MYMNIERLFELAGLPNKDLLLEATYDGMITKLKKDFPNNIKDIDGNFTHAKTILQKQDRIVWYLKVLRAYLSNDIIKVNGDYNFTNMEQFNHDLFHYYGFNIGEIQNTELTNQNISELFDTFQKAIDTYKKSPKAPVPVQHGDYELIKCNDGNSWWFIDRGFCDEEGRSGRHCGNVMGQHDTTQRILSLRTPKHNVILTFILERNGFLGEMKAVANQKPAEKYHPNIMQLLLNPMVKGIKGAGHHPWMNFSIFDLSDNDIKILIQHNKESFITDQIKSSPMEFLKTPDYIKNNKQYQQIAIQTLPVLQHILNNENDLDAWEKAIDENESMLIYAPDTLNNFEDRVTQYIIKAPRLLFKCPKSVSQNFNILSALINNNSSNIQYIMPSVPRYTELVTISLNDWGGNLQYISDTTKDYMQLCKLAVEKSATAIKHISTTWKDYYQLCKYAVTHTGGSLNYIDNEFQTLDLCKLAVSHWGYALEYVPFDKFTDDEKFEICKTAITEHSHALQYIPKDVLSDEQMLKLGKISVSKYAPNIKYVPDHLKDKVKQELNIQESLDFTYFQNL